MKTLAYYTFLLISIVALTFTACDDDDIAYEQTRLFRPVTTQPLESVGNVIIVSVGNLKDAVSYTYEVSRDTFQTIDYTIESDSSYLEIDKDVLGGKELLWNTLYQIRVTAHASAAQYDSKPSDLGSVRTQRFPSILNVPSAYDVTDIAARVTWALAGAPVTMVRVFAITDLGLENALLSFDVSTDDQLAGETIVTGLEPSTTYQIAIYSGASGETLRGWVNYTTKEKGVYPGEPGVVDLTENEDPDAVVSAVAAAADGAIILVKKGVQYNLPSDPLDKSITIRGIYGFGPEKAILYTTGNWNLVEGSQIDHIRFIDLEVRGEDSSGDYVFNPNIDGQDTRVREVLFENCFVVNLRGIFRIRGTVFIENFNIDNTIVSTLGNYGIFTADTDGDGKAAFLNVALTNSTFQRMEIMFTSRQNSESFLIDNCSFNEYAPTGGRVFRYRGGDGFNNITNGVTITNTIWGHGWDMSGGTAYDVRFIAEGLAGTNFTLSNNWGTSEFEVTAGYELAGFPDMMYNGKASDLWVDPYDGIDFTIKDNAFGGRFTAGDPRWRPSL